MNFIPQVETAEMADADLDNVSGGMAGGASGGLTGGLAGGASGGLLLDTPSAAVGADLCAFLSAEGGVVAADAHVQVGAH
ncbi:hypothetical protein SNL152K_9507 [Streptomyces sp. NL15-2K]|nr:hypothetical protein SNL152K_9507 [Streptomyces sp. NL15-2K]